ncbi:MAG: hypothetical protein KAQ67_09930 [Gammaproteobacteria bacterium]|nr:hypothetical protein [Gammaproteobacteria bacterium]
MSNTSPNYHNYIYSTVVILGIIICSAAIYISTSNINEFEHNTNRIHRLITASAIELDTLESEALVIESTLKDIKDKVSKKKNKGKKYTKEFFSLKQNIADLRTDIAEKQKLLISLNLLKTSTLSQIKILFWINSFLLVFGSLMVLIGISALIFKLEVFQDRRIKKRLDKEKKAD